MCVYVQEFFMSLKLDASNLMTKPRKCQQLWLELSILTNETEVPEN